MTGILLRGDAYTRLLRHPKPRLPAPLFTKQRENSRGEARGAGRLVFEPARGHTAGCGTANAVLGFDGPANSPATRSVL